MPGLGGARAGAAATPGLPNQHSTQCPSTFLRPCCPPAQGAEPWWQLRELLDEAWFVHCDVEEAMRRVYARQTGHGVAPEVSRWRVAANDRPNAEQVHTTARHATLLVPTLPLGGKQGGW